MKSTLKNYQRDTAIIYFILIIAGGYGFAQHNLVLAGLAAIGLVILTIEWYFFRIASVEVKDKTFVFRHVLGNQKTINPVKKVKIGTGRFNRMVLEVVSSKETVQIIDIQDFEASAELIKEIKKEFKVESQEAVIFWNRTGLGPRYFVMWDKEEAQNWSKKRNWVLGTIIVSVILLAIAALVMQKMTLTR